MRKQGGKGEQEEAHTCTQRRLYNYNVSMTCSDISVLDAVILSSIITKD